MFRCLPCRGSSSASAGCVSPCSSASNDRITALPSRLRTHTQTRTYPAEKASFKELPSAFAERPVADHHHSSPTPLPDIVRGRNHPLALKGILFLLVTGIRKGKRSCGRECLRQSLRIRNRLFFHFLPSSGDKSLLSSRKMSPTLCRFLNIVSPSRKSK